MTRTILLRAAAVLPLASLALAGDRVEVSLNGTWEYQHAEQLGVPPDDGPWKPFEVPGYLSGFDYQRAWFRRSFDVPEAMRGKRIKLRFGFREFWTDGHKFVLNGTPINLLMTSSWPPRERMSREAIRERWEAVKRAGCVAFRTHTQPWRRIHYEVADEVGLLIVVEGAVWNDDTVYRVFDPSWHTVFFGDEAYRNYIDRVYVAPDLRQGPGTAEFVTMPYATAVMQHGAGMLVLDQLKWDEQPHSSKRATRYALAVLAVLDADFPLRNVTSIRCADMEPEPGLQHYHNAGSHVVLGTNGHIRMEIDVARAGWYGLELVARGTQAEDVYPEVQICIDGKAASEVQLSGEGWRTYLCRVKLRAGKRELSLAFTNDKHIPGVADRNLWLDQVRLSPE